MKSEAELRAEKLALFEQSKGKQFQIKVPQLSRPLVDEIEGVDREYDHVIGRTYGNFHVDLVELVD